MNKKNDYINKINVLAIVFISIYCISFIGYDVKPVHKLIYVFTRLVTNLGFPLLLMTFGALMLKKQDDPLGCVKKTYKTLIPSFIIWNVILGILILHYNGTYLFTTTLTKTNWFIWIILSNVLVVPILSEFIHYEKENGIKYILALFVISSILWSLSIQFDFSLYYIDLVFFSEPLAFMVLGYYLSNKEFEMDSSKLFIICLAILVFTLFLRVLLIITGVAGWNAFFTQIFGTTMHISLDPFTIVEVAAIFLMIKSVNGVLNNNSVINLYSKKSFSIIMVLGIFTFILSKLSFSLSWIKLTIFSTLIFFIIAGILFFILDKIPLLKKFC